MTDLRRAIARKHRIAADAMRLKHFRHRFGPGFADEMLPRAKKR